jgi:apolipoprotein N-acyltransferase
MSSDSIRRALTGSTALLASAVLFFFGTGLAPIAALAWLAPLPVLLAAPRIGARFALVVAFLAVFLGTANSWTYYLHSRDVPLPMGALTSVGSALMFVLVVWIFRTLLGRGRALLAAAAAPAGWVGVLYLVSLANPLGVVGTLATAQADVPLVLQVTSVTGAWGVEFLVLFVPSAIAAVLAPGVRSVARWRTGISTAVLLGIVLGGGMLRLSNQHEPGQRVALIAHNRSGWGNDVATPTGRELLTAYLDQIAALPDGVITAVLPEGQFSVNGSSFASLAQPLAQAARARHVDIVAGVIRREPDADVNIALAFPAEGGNPVAYRKHHDLTSPPTHDLAIPPTAGVRMGLAICADVNFPNPSRDYAQAGSRLLAIPASDEDTNAWQHSRTALLRGVEAGQSVAWSARRGALLIADGFGHVRAETRTGGPTPFTTLIADAPAGPGATPYAHLGDWFPWLCLALPLVGMFFTTPRRARPIAEPEPAAI